MTYNIITDAGQNQGKSTLTFCAFLHIISYMGNSPAGLTPLWVQCMQNWSGIKNECFDHKTFQAYN